MTSLDKHYYETFDQIGNPFYDWERQLINLGCNVSDIRNPPLNLDSLKLEN